MSYKQFFVGICIVFFVHLLLTAVFAVEVVTGIEKVITAAVSEIEIPPEVTEREVLIIQEPEEVPETETPEPASNPEAAEMPKWTSIGEHYITGYDPLCSHCCGKSDGITASGTYAEKGMVAMADVPFGTKIKIEGLGEYTVQDRGVKTGVVDVVCGSHEECYAITGNREVWIETEDK